MGIQDTRRSSLPLRRWCTRLIVFSVVMYGSVLVSLLTKQHQRLQNQPNSVRQRSLQGIGQSDIQLLRVNTNDDDSTPSNATESTIVSNGSWRYSMEERLPEFGDEDPSSVAVKARDMAGSLANSLSNTSAMEAQLRADAELHARSVKILPAGETRKRALKCIGWRQTGHKSPNGPREPENDLTCTDLVSNKASGYCEVEDINSGERFRVMRRSSNILRNRVPFRCINAPAFAQYHIQAHAAVKSTLDPNDASRDLPPQDGIVMVVYPKLIPSAYATIRALRVILGCSLPIEIWYRPDEMEHVPNALVPLRHLANNSSGARISFHPITDPAAKRFVTKIYAINHSFFDRVLFLDADNVPVRDPSFLFSSPEFLETGAIFWPDFWHPTSTMFGLHSRSLLWELLDMPFVDMFEQESGQLVVDRRRHAAPLKLVLFYATHEPNFFAHYKLAWGDKDLFRLAWLKLNAPFHMVETPPAMAGMVTNSSAFCGMTMVQHDPEGDVLFLHRNKHKLTGMEPEKALFYSSEPRELVSAHGLGNITVSELRDPIIWTHLLSFDEKWSRQHYVIQAFTTSLEFANNQKCFGRRSLGHSPQFYIQPFADQTFAGIEKDLVRFAKQATQI